RCCTHRCILSKKVLKRIMTALFLPAERTTTSSDLHYRCARCLCVHRDDFGRGGSKGPGLVARWLRCGSDGFRPEWAFPLPLGARNISKSFDPPAMFSATVPPASSMIATSFCGLADHEIIWVVPLAHLPLGLPPHLLPCQDAIADLVDAACRCQKFDCVA